MNFAIVLIFVPYEKLKMVHPLHSALINSPELKVQDELLVSEGDDPLFVVMWHEHWSTPLKLLVRFTLNLVRSILVTVSFEFAIIILIDPFKGSPELKIEKPLNFIFYITIRSRGRYLVCSILWWPIPRLCKLWPHGIWPHLILHRLIWEKL